jgi:hypothetical protein
MGGLTSTVTARTTTTEIEVSADGVPPLPLSSPPFGDENLNITHVRIAYRDRSVTAIDYVGTDDEGADSKGFVHPDFLDQPETWPDWVRHLVEEHRPVYDGAPLDVPVPDASPREREIRARLDEASEGPWFVSDAEGRLQVWREAVLEHVVRDGNGAITGWSTPNGWRINDLVHEVDLETWDEGEDPEEDLERANARLIGHAPADLEHLLAEQTHLRLQLANVTAAYNALAARKQRFDQELERMRAGAADRPA